MNKGKIPGILSQIKKGISYCIMYPGKVLKIASELLIAYAIYLCLTIVKDISSSGFEGDFELFSRDDMGRVELGKVNVKKSKPVQHKNERNYILRLDVESDGSKEIGGGKKIYGLFDTDLYGTGSLRIDGEGSVKAGVGVLINF